MKHRFSSGIAFIRECLRSPKMMGTICPSSRALAKKMAEKVDRDGTGLVVELGAGTGRVTEALLARGIRPGRLFILERSQPLADVLRLKFPGLKVVCGDAAKLSSYLPGDRTVDCIVSSLPFASLNASLAAAIIVQIREHTGNGGKVVQYTYLFGRDHLLARSGFTCLSTAPVWKNLPPARVMEFRAR